MSDVMGDLKPEFMIQKMTPDVWVKGAGRRGYQTYRDMGVKAATQGRVKFQSNKIDKAEDHSPTGWHYHICELHVGFVLNGWLDIEFESGLYRLNAGDCICIPPGMPHNEIRVSDGCVALEMTIPADMKTVDCEAPASRAGSAAEAAE